MCRPTAWEKKYRLQVYIDHGVPVGFSEIDRVIATDDAGIVDQNVDLTELRPG